MRVFLLDDQSTHKLVCWCAWRLVLVNLWDQSAEKWRCPSCIDRRWYCTDIGVPAPWWTHRSWCGTSSTEDLTWSVDSHHCPENRLQSRLRPVVISIYSINMYHAAYFNYSLDIRFNKKCTVLFYSAWMHVIFIVIWHTSSNSSVIFLMISACSMLAYMCGVILPLQPELWMKNWIRSRRAESRSCL